MKTICHTAVITGATSGIGKAFATEFAKQGLDLIITGRREEELLKVADDLSSGYNVRIETFIGDLADPDNRLALCRMIKQAGMIDVLINNAGFGFDRTFHGSSLDDIRSMISTHIMATTEITYAVLPGMISRRKGTIINVSSLAAFLPGLTRTMYLSTKSFIHYFTESLFMEVRSFGIRVQSLCPGMTHSDFHRYIENPALNRKFHLVKFMTPESVVSVSLKELEKGWVLCIPGSVNKLFYILAKCLPSRILMKIAKFRNEEPEKNVTGYSVPALVSYPYPLMIASQAS
ncbi:MAG: SDR family oxidoreductase [Bacteroidetes bacterium]|nr:SDR family oxidoreductase [Bacteroidota bacterium]